MRSFDINFSVLEISNRTPFCPAEMRNRRIEELIEEIDQNLVSDPAISLDREQLQTLLQSEPVSQAPGLISLSTAPLPEPVNSGLEIAIVPSQPLVANALRNPVISNQPPLDTLVEWSNHFNAQESLYVGFYFAFLYAAVKLFSK